MHHIFFSVLLLSACSDEPESCISGFSRADDGNCYEVIGGDGGPEDGGSEGDGGSDGHASFDDVLDSLPDCEPGETDGRLDLEGGCADGACVGMTHDEIVAALGAEPSCESWFIELGSFSSSYLSCDWSSGIGASFDDDDRDGVADDDATARSLYVELPWDGGTTDGLGPWASLSCFVDALGRPYAANVELDDDDDQYAVTGMSFDAVSIYDWYTNKDLGYGSDGLVDRMTLYGAW